MKPEHLVLEIPFHDRQTRSVCHLPEPSVHLLKRDFTYVYLVAFGVERTHPELIIRGGIKKILVHPIRVVGTVELDSLSDGQGHFSLLSDSVRSADGDSFFDLFRRRRFGLTEGRFSRESEHNPCRPAAQRSRCSSSWSFVSLSMQCYNLPDDFGAQAAFKSATPFSSTTSRSVAMSTAVG